MQLTCAGSLASTFKCISNCVFLLLKTKLLFYCILFFSFCIFFFFKPNLRFYAAGCELVQTEQLKSCYSAPRGTFDRYPTHPLRTAVYLKPFPSAMLPPLCLFADSAAARANDTLTGEFSLSSPLPLLVFPDVRRFCRAPSLHLKQSFPLCRWPRTFSTSSKKQQQQRWEAGNNRFTPPS